MDLRSRLQALIAARVIVGTLLLGSAFLVQLSAQARSRSIRSLS
jgi:hypothetical protein